MASSLRIHQWTCAQLLQRILTNAVAQRAVRLVAEGVAARASDVDVVMVQGYGFPRWEGGPVFWARQQDRAALEQERFHIVFQPICALDTAVPAGFEALCRFVPAWAGLGGCLGI